MDEQDFKVELPGRIKCTQGTAGDGGSIRFYSAACSFDLRVSGEQAEAFVNELAGGMSAPVRLCCRFHKNKQAFYVVASEIRYVEPGLKSVSQGNAA